MEELVREYSEKLASSVVELVRKRLAQILPSPPYESKRLIGEINLLFKSSVSKGRVRPSVIEIGLSIMESDKSASELQSELGLHRVTVYKALRTLRDSGFALEEQRRWTLDRSRCPILRGISRGGAVLVLG